MPERYQLPGGNIIISDARFIEAHHPGAVLLPAIPESKPTRLTVLQFRQRFTLQEKAAIEFAAIDDPTAPAQQRQQSAMLRAVLADQAAAEFIDLADPGTVESVQLLVQAGLLTEPRGAEVLTP